MRKPKVLVFSTSNFRLDHGGVLLAKTFLEVLARLPDMDFIVVFSGPEDARIPSQTFVQALGLDYVFVPFRQVATHGSDTRFVRIASTLQRLLDVLLEKYYFWGERRWRQQQHVGREILDICKERRPDLLIVNGMFSAFYLRAAFKTRTPCCLITQDNDVPFYRALKAQGGTASMSPLELWIFRHGNWIPNIRVRRYLNWIYRRCAVVVTLTENDMPGDLPEHVLRAVIPPILSKKEPPWSYRGTRCIFFVGGILAGDAMHFANWAAIEWISSRLAPELYRIDRAIRINIIGARADQVPESWRCGNINFMGRSDKEEVIRQMTTADLFIAPIATNFGAKMKLAECVSHGTPFLATLAAMSGLPFLKFMPRIELDQPGVAARVISQHIHSPELLRNLSQLILTGAQQARAEQDVAWANVLRRSLSGDIAQR